MSAQPARVILEIESLILDGVSAQKDLVATLEQALLHEVSQLVSTGGAPSESQISRAVSAAVSRSLSGAPQPALVKESR